MKPQRQNPIPLPCALLALSVAVCIGAAGSAQASSVQIHRGLQAEQRQTLGHLIDAIQIAARKLTDQLTGQSAHPGTHASLPTLAGALSAPSSAKAQAPAVLNLREALLNLPPPVC